MDTNMNTIIISKEEIYEVLGIKTHAKVIELLDMGLISGLKMLNRYSIFRFSVERFLHNETFLNAEVLESVQCSLLKEIYNREELKSLFCTTDSYSHELIKNYGIDRGIIGGKGRITKKGILKFLDEHYYCGKPIVATTEPTTLPTITKIEDTDFNVEIEVENIDETLEVSEVSGDEDVLGKLADYFL